MPPRPCAGGKTAGGEEAGTDRRERCAEGCPTCVTPREDGGVVKPVVVVHSCGRLACVFKALEWK